MQGEAGRVAGCRAAAWASPLAQALLPPPEVAGWAAAGEDLRAALQGPPPPGALGGAPLHKACPAAPSSSPGCLSPAHHPCFTQSMC